MTEGVPERVQPASVPSTTDPLRLRASDADRDKVAHVLREAYAEGRLTAIEHEDRIAQVYSAQTYAELVPILHDLPVPPGTIAVPTAGLVPLAAVTPQTSDRTAVVVDPSRASQATSHAVAIMSGVERKGRWVVPAESTAIAIMGGIEYDFSEAVFTARETVITVFALMGGVEAVVPPGVDVRVEVFGFMGGSQGPRDSAPAGSPVVVFKGLAVMGGLEVKRQKNRDGRRSINQ
jgi:hypothetical protein